MAAWLIGHLTVGEPAKRQGYVGQVGATVAEAGGKVVFRGRLRDQMCGEAPGWLVDAIRFADLASLREWHKSPAYRRLIPIRQVRWTSCFPPTAIDPVARGLALCPGGAKPACPATARA